MKHFQSSCTRCLDDFQQDRATAALNLYAVGHTLPLIWATSPAQVGLDRDDGIDVVVSD